MTHSEIFEDCFTQAGTPGVDCEHCGRTHFTHEDADCESLRAKAEKQPDKYIEQDCDSLAFGILDGRQYVFGCPCKKAERYEQFVWDHREQIADYLKRRAQAEVEEAQRTLNAVS